MPALIEQICRVSLQWHHLFNFQVSECHLCPFPSELFNYDNLFHLNFFFTLNYYFSRMDRTVYREEFCRQMKERRIDEKPWITLNELQPRGEDSQPVGGRVAVRILLIIS